MKSEILTKEGSSAYSFPCLIKNGSYVLYVIREEKEDDEPQFKALQVYPFDPTDDDCKKFRNWSQEEEHSLYDGKIVLEN